MKVDVGVLEQLSINYVLVENTNQQIDFAVVILDQLARRFPMINWNDIFKCSFAGIESRLEKSVASVSHQYAKVL